MLANRRFTRSVAALAAISFCAMACGRSSSRSDSTASAGEVSTPNALSMVRGVVSDVTPTTLVVKTDTGSVSIGVGSSQVFERQPGTLADVTDNTFVGVTSVKQSDGTEQATEIHVFPDALRGLGDGSRMMEPSTSPSGSRMTNGSVQSSRMTKGTAAPSRMSNGTVSGANGGTLVVTYSGGSQTIDVPANTPVTSITATSRKPSSGDQVVVVSQRGNNGALTAKAVLFISK